MTLSHRPNGADFIFGYLQLSVHKSIIWMYGMFILYNPSIERIWFSERHISITLVKWIWEISLTKLGRQMLSD